MMRYGRSPGPRSAAVAALFALPLVSCANPRVDDALYARTALLGMPKATLLSCAGVPTRSATLDGLEYFTYRSERSFADTRTSVGFFGGHHRFGYGLGFPLTDGYYETRACEATFTLRNGVVEQIVYGGTGRTSGRLSQCYDVVANCLALVPPRPQAP